MVNIVVNGITYDLDLLTSNDNRGYAELVTPGVGGGQVPRYIAIMLDALADASKNLVSASTTSESIGSGTKNLTLTTEIPLNAGTWIIASDAANPTTKYMVGQVTSRSGTAVTFNVPSSDYYTGTGTVSDWNVSVTGPLGPTGATGEISVDEFQKQTDIFGTTGGSSNAYTLTLTTASGAIVAGHRYCIIPNHTNTGAATLNVSGQGAENIFYGGKALTGGEIQSGTPLILVHDGTQFNIASNLNKGVSWIKLIDIPTPADGDYVALRSIPTDLEFLSIKSIAESGTCTATVKINTTALGGTANSVSSTTQTQAHSSSNSASVDDDIKVTISSNSVCKNMSLYAKVRGDVA
jgi:hypothetical protein